jgi:glutathione S-transferase
MRLKGLTWTERYVSLVQQPQWVLDLAPTAKVPVLLVDDRPTVESSAIIELLDELYPAPPFFPRLLWNAPGCGLQYRSLLRAAQAELLGKADPTVLDAEHALETLRLSLATQRSIEEHRAIDIGPARRS